MTTDTEGMPDVYQDPGYNQSFNLVKDIHVSQVSDDQYQSDLHPIEAGPTPSIAETILNWRDEVLADPQPSWNLVHPHTWFRQSVEQLLAKL